MRSFHRLKKKLYYAEMIADTVKFINEQKEKIISINSK